MGKAEFEDNALNNMTVADLSSNIINLLIINYSVSYSNVYTIDIL